jgi:hypothetical protein
MTRYSVRFPTACTLQVWSTAVPSVLRSITIGFETLGDHLVVDPVIPATLGQPERLENSGVENPGRWNCTDASSPGRIASIVPT